MVVEDGDTVALPGVALAVKPPVEVQEVPEGDEDQYRFVDWPLTTEQEEAEDARVAPQVREAVAGGFASVQEAVLPPPEPWQDHVQELAPLTLLALVPAAQE